MEMFSPLVFGVALVFGAAWGAGENRCWKEHGEAVILSNFKLYHLLMAVLFGWVDALTVGLVFAFAFGFGPASVGWNIVTLEAVLSWLGLMIWDTWALDVVWWSIRYFDFKWDYEKAVASYGETNASPDWRDWDNCPVYILRLNPLRIEKVKLPLFFGVYWWWLAFPVTLVVIGSVIVYV